MASSTELILKAFAELERNPGFADRSSQKQLALLIHDMIEGDQSGLFEAPTGTGKSLACLIPSIAQAAQCRKKVVIATYTNVLAEQYWKKDLPFALSLFDGLVPAKPDIALLMGRQRYCCIKELEEIDPKLRKEVIAKSRIGHETDFKRIAKLSERTANALWLKVVTPVVCPGRLCSDYSRCYYYSARRAAAKSGVIITNHSVIIQDALMKTREGSEGLLGDYDFLILDEAHDFPLAAMNGLEFELNTGKLQTFIGIGNRLGRALTSLASAAQREHEWIQSVQKFEQDAADCMKELNRVGLRLVTPGIVAASPQEIFEHELVKKNKANLSTDDIKQLALMVESTCDAYSEAIDTLLEKSNQVVPVESDGIKETIRNYRLYLDDFASSIHALMMPQGTSVTHAAQSPGGAKIRYDTIGLAEPLKELLWANTAAVCLSATLAVDQSFAFFSGAMGITPSYEEILDSPFDYARQAALYLPVPGSVPDPSEARKNQSEPAYFQALAKEITRIIQVCNGRTLVLFHSRREMEAVGALVPSTPERPIYIQSSQGVVEQGNRFRELTHSSLFALRSFWTGFDAPGETLSCLVLVRIPFEVPIDPPQIVRAAHLLKQGLNPFASYTLPMAKMMVRQGTGRLIRTPEDRGVIAILDPRVQTKRYGEDFLQNLPPGISTFRSIEDAAGFVGLSGLGEAIPSGLF